MGRKTITYKKRVIEVAGLDTILIGEETVCEQMDFISYNVYQQNGSSLAGTVTIQMKDDGEDWIDLLIDTISLAGTSDIYRININETNFKYIRPKLSVTAGSADFIVTVKGKTIAA